jgi:hypothetical protein
LALNGRVAEYPSRVRSGQALNPPLQENRNTENFEKEHGNGEEAFLTKRIALPYENTENPMENPRAKIPNPTAYTTFSAIARIVWNPKVSWPFPTPHPDLPRLTQGEDEYVDKCTIK